MARPSILGRQIRYYRELKGWSQEELSVQTGNLSRDRKRVPRTTIASCESGIQRNLSIGNVVKIADALGVSVDALVR